MSLELAVESAALVAAPARDAGAPSRLARAVFLAFVFWIPIETVDVFGGSGDSKVVTLSRLIGALLCVVAAADWRRCFRRLPAELWLAGWYVAAYAVSQLWIPRELDALFLAKQVILVYSLLIYAIATNLLRDPAFRGKALRFYGWWVSVVAVGMMLGVFGNMYLGEAGRGTILGQDPNVAAGFFALGAVCLAGDDEVLSSRRWLARLLPVVPAIGCLVMAIIWTGSRGGLLVFLAGVAALTACGGRRTRKRRAVIAFAAVCVFSAALVREFRNNTIAAGRLMQTYTEGDTAGRGKIYAEAWAMAKERPFFGYGGSNNFYLLGERLNHPSYGTFYRDTHNLFLAVLTEVGLVGGAPLVLALLVALRKAWRHGRRTGDALPFALLCTQIAINSSLTGVNQNLFWIALAAASAVG